MCCVIGKSQSCNLYFFVKQIKTISYFRFMFFKRSESAFWLRSSFLGAETMFTHLFSLFSTIWKWFILWEKENESNFAMIEDPRNFDYYPKSFES